MPLLFGFLLHIYHNKCRSGPGQQCCYDNNGNINVGPPGGGTVDNIAPTGYFSTIGHFAVDVAPFFACCKAGLLSDCAAYYEYRPSDDCSRTRPPPPGEVVETLFIIEQPAFFQCIYLLIKRVMLVVRWKCRARERQKLK